MPRPPSRDKHPRGWLRPAALAAALFGTLVAAQAGGASDTAPPAVDFSRQIRPLLSENCFACHGPDENKRKAKLRLDTKQGAFAPLRDGSFAIIPGKPGESRLIERITAEEDAQRMPPVKSGKHLTAPQ